MAHQLTLVPEQEPEPNKNTGDPSTHWVHQAWRPGRPVAADRRTNRASESAAQGASSENDLEAGILAGDRGAVTAEYAIVIMAAVAFAGLLVAIMSSGEIRGMLVGLVESALGSAG
ncbi:MAG: DUF4244 domain-containing protein [Leucobacter sp.]